MHFRWMIVGAVLLPMITPGCKEEKSREVQAHLAASRTVMLKHHLRRRGITDSRVLAAMAAVPREKFVPAAMRRRAYDDSPLPIGHGQTISQPYIVAFMAQAARIGRRDSVLEVGTGSGYGAAVLARLAAKVYSVEILTPLARKAAARLTSLGFKNVSVLRRDGYAGLPEKAPFDAIVVTAAPPRIPPPLLKQLKVGGRLVIPVGRFFQQLVLITRTKEGFRRKAILPVRFVKMTGRAQKKR